MPQNRENFLTPALLCVFAVSAGHISAQICPALTDEVRSRVAAYVADRYEFAPDVRVNDDGIAGGSCFRRIAVRVPGQKQPLELFLSPDQRFLSETLLDMTISPTAERRRVARETLIALRAESSPVQGVESPPVTLVVFSDFQCPFCKRFTEFLDRLPANDRQDIKVIFKQRPLAMHAWARRAAVASICASFESNNAFWGLDGFLFANQNTITPANLEDRIAEFAKSSGQLDFDRLRKCLADGSAEKILLRDEKLAGLYHVDSVPTVFINGSRSPGFRSAEELQALLHALIISSPPGVVADRESGAHAGSE
jgi:protein-disulfide isomerase